MGGRKASAIMRSACSESKQKKMPKRTGHKIFTGVTGEYFVAAEISRQGGIATITHKNTPDIDILASSVDGSRIVSIQVKTGRSDIGGFIVGQARMRAPVKNSFYAFVLLKVGYPPEYWIVPQSVVARTAELDYQNWIKGRPAQSKRAPRTLRWKRLRSRAFEKYHDNWDILRIW